MDLLRKLMESVPESLVQEVWILEIRGAKSQEEPHCGGSSPTSKRLAAPALSVWSLP